MANDLLKLGGLWKNTDKNGNEYLSGNFTYGTRLLIMKNSYKKEKGKDPDFIAYLAPKENKEDKDTSGSDPVPF